MWGTCLDVAGASRACAADHAATVLSVYRLSLVRAVFNPALDPASAAPLVHFVPVACARIC